MKSPRQEALFILFTLIVSVTGLVSCKSGHQSTNNSLTPVSFSCSRNLWATLPVVAAQKGFFDAEGLKVNIQYVQVAKLAMDSLVAGSSDAAALVDINMAYLGFTNNRDIAAIGTITISSDHAILARKSAGIKLASDLKGRRIGVIQGTTTHDFTEKFLKSQGMSVDSVELVNLQPLAVQTALVGKEIDAGAVWQPLIYNLTRTLGDDAVIFRDRNAWQGYMNLSVRKSWADKNRPAVLAFLRAINRAKQFISDRPDEAQSIMAGEVKMEVEAVKAIWGEYQFALQLDAGHLRDVITAQGKWIKQTQEAFKDKPLPDYSLYIDDSYLKGGGPLPQTVKKGM